MEYTNTMKMEIQNKKTGINMSMVIKFIMIALIIVAIFYQVKIVKMIMAKEEMLNAEPLSYGARKYGIEECTCYISLGKQIWFNQTTSITKVQKLAGDYQQLNFSGLDLD